MRLLPERAGFCGRVRRGGTSPESSAGELDISLQGADRLFLVADDGAGGGGGHVPCVWGNPRLVLESGRELALTDLAWASATTRWGEVRRHPASDGEPPLAGGRRARFAYGVHTKSVIEFDLPPSAARFRSSYGIQDVGPSLSGQTARFMVFALGLDAREPGSGVAVPVTPHELGLQGAMRVFDVWERRDLGVYEGRFAPLIPWHGAGLYRVSPAR